MSDFDFRIKRALSHQPTWDDLTAAKENADAVFAWLQQARGNVDADLARRRSEWAAFVAGSDVRGAEFKRELSAYQTWRKGALGFRGLVDRRIRDLKERHKESVKHRRADEAKELQASLIRVAKVIEAHQAERASDADLYGVLDEVAVPWGVDGRLPLRALLDRLAAA